MPLRLGSGLQRPARRAAPLACPQTDGARRREQETRGGGARTGFSPHARTALPVALALRKLRTQGRVRGMSLFGKNQNRPNVAWQKLFCTPIAIDLFTVVLADDIA